MQMSLREHSATNWVIKLSKLCNLRCSYCYEWNELHNPNRMSLDLVEKIVLAAREFHQIRTKSMPSAHTTLIVHGGEPFILPPEYLRSVFDSAKASFANLSHTLFLQSNMYKVSDTHLDICKEYGVRVGVSYDLARGVRITQNGLESEDQADRNIQRAQKKGFNLGGVVVLAKHTASNLRKAHDYYVSRGMPFRVLPLSDGPVERPAGAFELPLEEALAAMRDLFDYWIANGRQVAVEPFNTYLRDAINYMLEVPVGKYDRLVEGDYALFANVDGLLYAERDAYDEALALGNLNTQSIQDILQSDAYRRSTEREARLVAHRCSSCEFDKSCAGLHLISTKPRGAFDDPCSIAPAIIGHIAGRLNEWGYGADHIRSMLSDEAFIEAGSAV